MRVFCFDLIRNGDLVSHLHCDESVAAPVSSATQSSLSITAVVETKALATYGYDESVTTHSFVVVSADTNLIFKDVSDLKELT